MSFFQWEWFKRYSTQQAYVDLTAPVVGDGSLRLVGASTGTGAIQGRWAQAANRGFRQGRITTLVQPLAGVAAQDMYGVYGAASQSDLTGASGTCYAALLVVGGSPTTWNVTLVKVTAGFGGTLTVLQTHVLPMAFGQPFGIQLQWLSDPQIGTAVRLAFGTALDLRDLVEQPVVQEPSVFIQASSGEGPVAVLTASGDVRFDTTSTEEI